LALKYFELENFKKPLELKNEVFEKDSIVLAVTVNGKKRCEIEVPLNSSNEEVLLIAKESAKKWLENSTIIKEIVVPNKLVNIVIKA
jgi:leucyl-tRNA synthetase